MRDENPSVVLDVFLLTLTIPNGQPEADIASIRTTIVGVTQLVVYGGLQQFSRVDLLHHERTQSHRYRSDQFYDRIAQNCLRS